MTFYQLSVKINGIDRSNKVIWRSFQLNDEVDDTPSTLSFEINVYELQQYSPEISDSIVVYFDNTILFSGRIMSIEDSGDRFAQTLKIKCKDNTAILDNILITARYKNMTVNAIINAIISDSRFNGVVTDTNVNADINVTSIAFNAQSATKCIQKLANQINYTWYIDENNDIHFFAKNSEVAPFNISDTSNNYLESSFTFKRDLSQLKNVIQVRGGEQKSEALKIQTIPGDGVNDTFTLDYKYSEEPVVKLNGNPLNVGLEYVNKDDLTFDCWWAFSESRLRFKVVPLITDIITIEGYPLMPILVTRVNGGSISKYGRYEYKIENKSIKSVDEANQLAIAQLDSYSSPIINPEFSTYEVGLRAGQSLNIKTRGISGNFIIQTVSLKILAVRRGDVAQLQDVDLNNIRNNAQKDINILTGDNSSVVLPIYSIKCASIKTLDIIYFLQKLLLRDSDNLDLDENVVLDLLNLDMQNVIMKEEIIKNPFGDGITPIFVLAPYYPTDIITDRKRPTRQINNKFRINIT